MRRILFYVSFAALVVTSPAFAGGDIYFNIAERKAQLQQKEYAKAREYCLAGNINIPKEIPAPIESLYAKEGYGNDNRMEPFTLYVMILGGRALAGDEAAAKALRDLLRSWADADALWRTPAADKTYYPLQRYMIPVLVNFAIVADGYSTDTRAHVEAWLDKVMRPLGKHFGGDVEHNNHRYLADSAVMAWGAYRDDDALYQQGMEGFKVALREALADGRLPLETRRGARASWYMRHALTNLTLMAEIARHQGDNLYDLQIDGKSVDSVMNQFITGSYAPLAILPDAAMNYKPGDSFEYLKADAGYLKRRTDRHYMAFAEAYTAHHKSFASLRLRQLLSKAGSYEGRPFLDDYFGGNATCFFWQPESE
jgi:poly(beta-D-mannuronate) lyase